MDFAKKHGLKIQTFSSFDAAALEIVHALEGIVFESPMTKNEILTEAKNKTDLVILIASINDTPCGYKVGFQQSSKRFYSWIGGVHPDYRGRGIAKALMQEQHRLAKNLGYKFVFTHTKNKFRFMLLLNIKIGFDIIGVRHNLGSPDHSIILEKSLD